MRRNSKEKMKLLKLIRKEQEEGSGKNLKTKLKLIKLIRKGREDGRQKTEKSSDIFDSKYMQSFVPMYRIVSWV